nr:LuxR family transcriptional regulator [uncultured Sphingomonas sp.]
MYVRNAFEAFAAVAGEAATPEELQSMMEQLTRDIGCVYFALSHHVDVEAMPDRAIRLHNYPERWAATYDAGKFAIWDPVHRASQRTSFGFAWRSLPGMVPLSRQDRQLMAMCAEHGLGEGYTIPANVPGEAHGSCTFVSAGGAPFPLEGVALAQLAGAFAFESARRLWRTGAPPEPAPTLTDRQRDCLIWIARGKTDWETSRIMGVSPETIVRHVKEARDRYGVHKRTSLLIRALLDGTISFADVQHG